MFSIGEFARLGGVSVRTLRYYEEVGLLTAAAVDDDTGYRSYSGHQLPRLHRIIALKELGLSLSQLRPLLEDVSAERLRGMLLMKRAELQQRVSDDQARLVRVEHRLRYIEREDNVITDIAVKRVPALHVAAIRSKDLGLNFYTMVPFARTAMTELDKRLTTAAIRPNGPVFLFYEMGSHDELVPSVAIDVGDQQVPVDDLISDVMLPPVDVVTTVLTGSAESPLTHDIVGPVYGELAQWADDHGYIVRGPGRDVMLDRGATTTNILEIQLPIERR
jgi:DNA-binding transcriptional MerR regulator